MPEDILKDALTFLKLAGLLPHNYIITLPYGLILTPVACILIFMEFYTEDLTFKDIVELIEVLSNNIEDIIKLIFFLVYQQELKELLVLRSENFWKINKFGEKYAKKLQIYPDVTIKILKTFYSIITLSVLVALTKPFIIHEVPMRCWVPEGETWFYVIVVFIDVLAVYTYTLYIAFNIFFCLVYVDCIVQFKLLKIVVTKMETREDMEMCVQHHDFLQQFMGKLNEPFGFYLFFQYFFGLSIVLMEMLMITDPAEDLITKIKATGFIVILFLELSLNYMLASFIQDESEELPTTIWLSNWHLKDMEYQRNIMLMIKMSQQEISIKGGQILQVDREAIINAVQATFSMYTFLAATSQKVT